MFPRGEAALHLLAMGVLALLVTAGAQVPAMTGPEFPATGDLLAMVPMTLSGAPGTIGRREHGALRLIPMLVNSVGAGATPSSWIAEATAGRGRALREVIFLRGCSRSCFSP